MTLSRKILGAAGIGAALISMTAASASAAITGNLVGHWPLNETAPASTVVANAAPAASSENGTRTETIEIGQAAPAGGAYSFDGSGKDDFVTLGTAVVEELRAANTMSISAWIKPELLRGGSGSASRQIIVGANNQFQFGLQDQGNLFYVTRANGADHTVVFDLDTPLHAGEFVHVAIVQDYDPGIPDNPIYVYVNGEQTAAPFDRFIYPAVENFEVSGNVLYLGRIHNDTGSDFDGWMSDVGLWAGRALSPEEVTVVGAIGRAGLPLSSPEIDSVINLYATGSGTVTAGDWEWVYTTQFASPADGSMPALGKHYYGVDDAIYAVLGGTPGNWQGVMATGGEPFALPIVITQQPSDQAVNMGESATFEVQVASTGPVQYQWYFRSPGLPAAAVENATGPVLLLESVQVADRGVYFCEISEEEGSGSVTTREAQLTLLDGPALIAHWKLDDLNLDSLEVLNSAPGALRHGERTETTAINETGQIGRAFAFGDGASIDTKYNAWIPQTDDFSVFAWIRTTNVHSVQGHVFSNNNSAAGRSNLHVLDGTVRYFLGGSPNLSISGKTAVNDGKWHHIGVTRSGTEFTLWVDGVADAFGFSSGAVQQDPDWAIGRRGRPAGGYPFDGWIDDVGVWHVALTPEEVAILGGLGRIRLPLSAEQEAADILSLYQAETGTVVTGDWTWQYATAFPPPADGSSLAKGKHYLVDESVYVVLDGSEGSWRGVMASGGDLNETLPIVITGQPADQEVFSGSTVEFSVEVQAGQPVTYQWFFKGEGGMVYAVPDGNAATLVLEDVQFEDEGLYFVRISEAAGEFWINSDEAALSMLDRPPALVHHWLLNDTAADLAVLDPDLLPAEDRQAEAPLVNEVEGGSTAIFVKGKTVDDPGPVFASPSPSPYSTGSIGMPSREAYISLGHVAPGTGEFTIAFWFNRNGDASNEGLNVEQHILQSNSGQASRWNVVSRDLTPEGTFSLRLWHQVSGTRHVAQDLASDQWYHFAMTRDRLNTLKLYLNGEEKYSGTSVEDFTNSAGGVFLGNDPNRSALDRAFTASFDDVRFYDGALSASQIMGLIVPDYFEMAILVEPDDQEVAIGETAEFVAVVDASGPVDLQWYFRPGSAVPAQALPGETNSTLTISNVDLADRGIYHLEVRERGGEAVLLSREARVSLLDGPALVGYWNLDETSPENLTVVNAALGASVHGERTENVLIGQPGMVGRAYSFQGDRAHVNTRSNDWVPATGDFSIFAWIRTDSFHETQGHIVSNNLSGTGRSNIYLEEGVVKYWLGGSPSLALVGSTMINDGTWRHVGVRRVGEEFFLSVDGVVEATGTSSIPVQQVPEWAIGLSRNPDANYAFHGEIDDVGIWRKALSLEEAALVGALGRAGIPLSAEAERTSVLQVFQAQGGSAVTGNWQWAYTGSFPLPMDGSAVALGRHYSADDGRIYVVLGGDEDGWTGLAGERIITGGYADWVASKFLPAEIEDAAISGPEAAPAGDGVANLLKYAFGMDPKTPADRAELPEGILASGQLRLAYTRAADVTDIEYVIELSEDLAHWISGAGLIEEVLVENRGETERVTVEVTDLPSETSRFFVRLRVRFATE